MMIKISGRSYTTSSSSPKTKMGNKEASGQNKPDYTRHILCTLLLRMPLVMLNMSGGIFTLLLGLSLATHVAEALPLPTNAPTCHDSSSTTTCHQVAHTSNGPSSSSSSQLELQQLPVAFTGVDLLTRSPTSLSDALLAAAPRSMLPTALATDATVTLSSEIEANRTANANGTAANGTATAADGGGQGEGEQHESWLKKAITTVKGWFSRRSNGELTRYIAREAVGGGINEGGGGTLDEIIERVLNAFLDHIDEADGGLNLTGTATATTTDSKQQQQQQHWQRSVGQSDEDAAAVDKRESPWDRWKIDDKQDGPVPWGNWKLGGRDGTGSGSLSSMLLAQRHQAVGAIQHDEVLGSRSSSGSSEGQHHVGTKADGGDVDRLRFISFVPHIPAAGSGSAKAW